MGEPLEISRSGRDLPQEDVILMRLVVFEKPNLHIKETTTIFASSALEVVSTPLSKTWVSYTVEM